MANAFFMFAVCPTASYAENFPPSHESILPQPTGTICESFLFCLYSVVHCEIYSIPSARMPAKTAEKNPQKLPAPSVVLCSRGYSFEDRLEGVTDYAERNKVKKVILLHCPEKKHSEKFVQDIQEHAVKLFAATNKKLLKHGKKELKFELRMEEGLLEDNLKKLLAKENVSVVFVGMKMLDYRLSEIKKLKTAFYFMGK
ncbi:MAG: hypothetical protein JWM56_376 [Candidatus Peribacteria bacterium]|nr:hypothetical protein [Candidatus Peribacteria bacterium]